MQDTNELDFTVRRDALSQVRWAEAQTRPDQALGPGEVLLRIERYGLSANNITYALVGELMRYWDFFPAEPGWGRIPVWGYAQVAASSCPDVNEGDRVFGYLPMSRWLRVRPERVTERDFMDGSEHRRALPKAYQRYARVPRVDPAIEDLRALLRPLSGTGFLLADWLHTEAWFGAQRVLFTSASSKTALATAFAVSRSPARDVELVGLTSERNRAFCVAAGYYDRVVAYSELESLTPAQATVFVDMAGDADVLRRVHTHFEERLRHSCVVGMTHGAPPTAAGAGNPLPGPVPQLFFAPAHVDSCVRAWGAEAFRTRLDAAEQAFMESARAWLRVEVREGSQAIEASYREMVAGAVPAQQGLILVP